MSFRSIGLREQCKGKDYRARLSRAYSCFIMNDSLRDKEDQSEGSDAGLDDAAQNEREYVRKRLREELQREPTDVELDEWLRQQTEGY